MLKTSAITHEHINNKLRFVLEHFLASYIDEFNGTYNYGTGTSIVYPKTIDIGVDSIRLAQTGSPIDNLPAINILPVGSTVNILDMGSAQDELLDFDVIALTGSEAGDLTFNSRMSWNLSTMAAQVIEKYLMESPGEDPNLITSIYRCDVIQTFASRNIPVKNTSYFLTATTTRIRVYSRSLYGNTSSLLPTMYKPKPAFYSNYLPLAIEGLIDTSSDITFTAEPLAFTTVSGTGAQFSGATTLTLTPDTSIADGTVFTITSQTTRAVTTATVTSGTITINLTGSFVLADNVVWTINYVGPSNVMCSYTLFFSEI